MAATLRSELSRLFQQTTAAHQSVLVRWKKKLPQWRDPADISWATPLLEKLQHQQQTSNRDKKDAEVPPAMLHLVTLVRSVYGRPYWEKRTVESLGLLKKHDPVVHKNSPSVNKLLASVKHLVKIVPITFPHGLPADESDFNHCVLHEDGRLEVKKKLDPLEECINSGEKEDKGVWKMDNETVEKSTRRVLEQFALSREYFPAKYVYKYNQDGKEYRYKGNQNIMGDRDWY